MKWITHQTGAVIAALALDLPLAGIGAACAGAIVPDLADMHVSRMGLTRRQQRRIFNKIHRGSSHWFGWWLAMFLFICFYPLPILATDALAGFAFGGLSHIILDMLTPRGIPLLPFSRKGNLALPLCSTGRPSEYVFLTVMVAAAIWFMGESVLNTLVRSGLRF